MSKGSSFLIVPWQEDFIKALSSIIIQETENATGNAVLIFPHSRPARYLREAFLNNPNFKKPLVLPTCLTVNDLMSLICAKTQKNKAVPISTLDQVALLHQVLEKLRRVAPKDSPLPSLPLDDFSLFLPWGTRLVGLIEDSWLQNREPESFDYLDGEVQPYAAVLLSSLGAIQAEYSRLLRKNNWTTQGFDAFNAARQITTASADELELFKGKKIILAGFYQLDASEEAVFKELWLEYGARVCLHSSSKILEGATHQACFEHNALMHRWGAELELFSLDEKNAFKEKKPELRIWEGYDLHSELAALHNELDLVLQNAKAQESQEVLEGEQAQENKDFFESTAIILPHTSLIMPTLHALPYKDVNISMGYPLDQSALARLLEIIMRLKENAKYLEGSTELEKEDSSLKYYWKDLQELYRHPLLRALKPEPNLSFVPLLKKLQTALVAGQPYADADLLLERVVIGATDSSANSGANSGANNNEAELNYLRRLHQVCIVNFSKLASPQDLSDALVALVVLLQEWGVDIWRSFPLDAECLYRLLQKIIPDFAHSVLKDKVMSDAALFALLRQSLKEERVPFEGEPLAGLQLIGFLESRLLSFKRLFVLEATEDKLPGAPGMDPLLPESLRIEMGLSSLRQRENMMSHNFWRLFAGADEVVIFTRSTQSGSGLLDERKIRSRFVEELIWSFEQEQGALLKPVVKKQIKAEFEQNFSSNKQPKELLKELYFKEDGPLRVVLAKAQTLATQPVAIPKSKEFLLKIMQRISYRGISASFLDAYLTCPFRFALERLCDLRENEGIKEDDDPRAVGDLIHGVLHEFFTPYLNKTIKKDNLDFAALQKVFLEHLNIKKTELSLPADSWLMLEHTGAERLRRMLENGPEQTELLFLEHTLNAEFLVDFKKDWAWIEQNNTLLQVLDAECTKNSLKTAEWLQNNKYDFIQPEYGTALDLSRSILFKFHGVIDRIDKREEEVFILDYKTGAIHEPKDSFWLNDELWASIKEWNPNKKQGIDNLLVDPTHMNLLSIVAENLNSVQMPLYMYMLGQNSFNVKNSLNVKNAFWVELSDSGVEKALFGAKLDTEHCAVIKNDYIPSLLTFILRHLFLTPAFFPRETSACRWCSFVSLCKTSVHS